MSSLFHLEKPPIGINGTLKISISTVLGNPLISSLRVFDIVDRQPFVSACRSYILLRDPPPNRYSFRPTPAPAVYNTRRAGWLSYTEHLVIIRVQRIFYPREQRALAAVDEAFVVKQVSFVVRRGIVVCHADYVSSMSLLLVPIAWFGWDHNEWMPSVLVTMTPGLAFVHDTCKRVVLRSGRLLFLV